MEDIINQIVHGDCLEVMKDIPDKSVDMILCDLPYGVTARNKWDVIIPFEPLWDHYKRIAKAGCSIVLTATEPFSSKIVMSNLKNYRHKWIWNKNNSAGFANANKQPFQICEDILVFGFGKVNYYPIMEQRGEPRKKGGYSTSTNYFIDPSKASKKKNNLYHPKNLLLFSNANQKGKVHPTQKPVALFEYLIKTYTNENETILDNCIGSGTTAIAAINTNRNFIGIEKDEAYHKLATERVKNHQKTKNETLANTTS